MKKVKSKFRKKLIISLCFLTVVGVVSYIHFFNPLSQVEKTPPIVKKYPNNVLEIKKELYAMEKLNQLFSQIENPINFDKTWEKYKGIVYKKTSKIDMDFKDSLVETVKVNGKMRIVPNKNINISVGENTLILTLKDKSLATDFGGNPATGEVTYKIWVKDKIDENKIIYSTNIDDTEVLPGLISTSGNTNGGHIISTRIKKGTGLHHATLSFTIDDTLIDYSKSYYVKGTNDQQNNFTETGSQIKLIENEKTLITTNGHYHLHLVDLVGNVYDSYLQLGNFAWRETLGDNLLE